MSQLPKPTTYTNRELGLMISDMKSSFDIFIKQNKEDHIKIQNAQAHTNGDVKSLKLWRAYLTGAFAVIAFMLSFVATKTEAFEHLIK